MKPSSGSDFKVIEAKVKPRALVVMMTVPRLCVIKMDAKFEEFKN